MAVKIAKWSWFIFVLLGLAACVSTPPQPPATPHPIDTLVLAPTSTATSLPTSTPTLTPTPTAVPLALFTGLRTYRSTDPAPQRGAPCGVVDFFDFPLDAPDGSDAQARWPFGYYSERYNGIHTGEDWLYNIGDSLGRPVYSIGHGMIIYAQPLGWGIDQGTIIVRHVFADGHSILSFYGHLQPDSVTLRPGTCVTRDQQIGLIGQPRGRPHLHFEIRSIYPDQPGPGYWSVDPTRAGWKPPTEYIWDQRISTSPGVKWTRPLTSVNSILAGLLLSDTLAVVDRDQLVALSAKTGRVEWSHPVSDTVERAVVSDDRAAVYLTTISSTLQAIDVHGDLRWQVPFTPTSRSVLIPSPDGGVIAHDGRDLIGFSRNGDQLWRIENLPPPIDWLNDNGKLLYAVEGDQPALYQFDRSGQLQQIASLGGQLAASVDHLVIYAPTALYRLSPALQLLKPLDRTGYHRGSVVVTPGGGVVIAHNGVDRRLIALRSDGSLRWDRSIQQLTDAAPQLVVIGPDVYAVTQEGDVWWIDQKLGEAQRVLDGTRLLPLPGDIRSVVTSDGTLIFDARGGRLIALDPRAGIVPGVPDDVTSRY
ncbi:MAG TPA: PQQ-binding-like beta-propeller repeat protein [Anaerolineae bacterium]|nr:PQQ-binding-like beta-propeller repeat protein [Anaerolineae bacterium]